MVNLTIDGQKLQAREAATILEVARNNNIDIPTLCYHEAVAASGACRLCLVEIGAGDKKRLVASCLYPVAEGLVVATNSERVLNSRRMIIKLLLARCSDSEVLQDLARRLGVKETPFEPEHKQCILCGRCVRVCQKAVGPAAISWAERGVDRKIVFPFYETSDACIGCGACAYVCPIETIKLEDSEATRTLTMPNPRMPPAEFKLKKCPTCGKYWATEKQLEYIARNLDPAPELLDSCLACREKTLLRSLGSITKEV